MSAANLGAESALLVTSVVTMPRLSGTRSTARQLAAGGPLDAAPIDCSQMEAASLSMAQELIHQFVDVRGARWVQLIEPTELWRERVQPETQRRGMAGALSVVPRARS